MNQSTPNQTANGAREPERVIVSHEEETVRHVGPVTTRRRQILIISSALAVLLVLIVFVVLVWRWRSAPAEEEKTKPVVSVKVAKAEREPIAAQISAVGTIWPRDKAEVAAKIGADQVWDKAEVALMQALEASGRPWTLNKGEGAFYGPKLEYVLRDAIGRDWQCGTVQVDLNMPGRLGAFYIDDHSNKVTPVMLHRAMFGSLERFTGIMIEHYAGHLPLWLAPVQAVVATITSDADDYAREAGAAAQRAGLRVEDDLRNEKINFKVREHSLAKIPVLLVVGKKEAAERAVSIRRLGSQQQTVMPLDRALAMLSDEAVAPDVKRLKQAA